MKTERILTAAGLAVGVAFGLAACGESGTESADAGAAAGSTADSAMSSETGSEGASATDLATDQAMEAASAGDTVTDAAEDVAADAASVMQEGVDMAQQAGSDAAAATGDSLATILDGRKAEFRANAPEELSTLFESGVEEVAQSGLIAGAVNVGDTAPEFVLPDAVGRSFSLAEALESGPVVLVWYRGGWCPYCNLTLRAYQERMDEITAAGATLVAISPEVPDKSLDTQQKNDLAFAVLSDVNNAVARRYGVVFELNAEVAQKYDELGLDLAGYNGNSSNELPLSATYVINPDGTVTYAFLDADYTKRAEPDAVMAALRSIDG